MPSDIAYDKYIELFRDEVKNHKKAEITQYLPELVEFFVSLLRKRRDSLSPRQKGWVASAIGYVLSPKDAHPEETWGEMGYLDDIYLCIEVLKRLAGSLEDTNELWSDRAKELRGGTVYIDELTSELGQKVREEFPELDRMGKKILEFVGLF